MSELPAGLLFFFLRTADVGVPLANLAVVTIRPWFLRCPLLKPLATFLSQTRRDVMRILGITQGICEAQRLHRRISSDHADYDSPTPSSSVEFWWWWWWCGGGEWVCTTIPSAVVRSQDVRFAMFDVWIGRCQQDLPAAQTMHEELQKQRGRGGEHAKSCQVAKPDEAVRRDG